MPTAKASVLLVEPDGNHAALLERELCSHGFEVERVVSGAAALAALEQGFDLVLSELELGGTGGLALLAELSQLEPELPVVLFSATATVKVAVEAMRRGAADFISKPCDNEELLFIVDKALRATARAREAAPSMASERRLLGDSPAILEIHETIRRAAPSLATVLVRGESGTGKELVARAVHEQSKRANGPFICLNCAALTDTLLESELFGYEKGAFTGASSRKPGRVELAEGGTLFLDEIGDITPALQAKLLRLLQDREFDAVGGTKTQKADVRFLAATHRNLEKMIKAGEFRGDLFFRLNVVPIRLPPLRERPEDLERLANHFCSEVARANERGDVRLDKGAHGLLRQQRWKGNVRELQNFIERLVILSDGPMLTASDVQRELAREPAISTVSSQAKPGITLEERLRLAERDALTSTLARAGNNRALTARLLGIPRRTLYTKLHEHDLV